MRRINHHQHRRPTDYTERAYRHRRTVASSSRHQPRHDLHRQGRTIASSSWCPSRRPTSTHRLTRGFDISAGPGASPSLHQPTPDTSASLADQLRHVSWAEGFVSASQPLPALPCRRFIAHQEMGVRSESQFWESPSFGWLQQINQVLLTSIFFACLGSIFPKELLLWFIHHMYTGLSNGGRINDGHMVVRSVSVHSPANATSGTRTDL